MVKDRVAGQGRRDGGRLPPTSRYAWLVGVAAVLVAGLLVIGSTRPAGPGAGGLRGELGDLRQVVGARRWSFAVGWDRDGVLASLYGVATCPYVVAARWRGRVQTTLLGSASTAGIERAAHRVVAASRAAGWRP